MASTPKIVRGFAAHGVRLAHTGGDEWRGTCPFKACQKRRPFTVNARKRVWTCMSCGAGGDWEDFLTRMAERYKRAFRGRPVLDLERERGVPRGALRRFGVGWSARARSWVLPSWSLGTGKVTNLRLWRPGRLTGTPGGTLGVIRPWDGLASDEAAWVCEGDWDAMVMDHVLSSAGAGGMVVGVPGASSVPRGVAQALADKHIVLAYDNDDPGRTGSAKMRAALEPGCASVTDIAWPPGKPVGHDVRDEWLGSANRPRVAHSRLVSYLNTAPGASPPTAARPGSAPAAARPRAPSGRGMTRAAMLRGYRRWLHLPDPTVLDVMFGTVFANRMGGDPVWLYIVGPGGCGKTEPIISLYDAPLIEAASLMTPASLISGTKNAGAADPSLIPKWKDRVVVMKDFTVVLSLPPKQRDEVFGILRGAFDGRVEKVFGNGVRRVFRSRFGIIAGVTPEIEKHGPSSSALGERFLRFRVRNKLTLAAGTLAIDSALDTAIDREQDRQHEELRAVARRVLDREVTSWPGMERSLRRMFRRLAQWAAAMRGAAVRDKYTRHLEYRPQAEVGTRLAVQLGKLAVGIAVLRQSDTVGADEFNACARVAMDSVPDLRADVSRVMWRGRESDPLTADEIAERTELSNDTVQQVLEDGRLLRLFVRKRRRGASPNTWRLAPGLIKLVEPLGVFD